MKKVVLSVLVAATAYAAQAQIGQGGIPMSRQIALKDQYIPASHYALPDWEGTLAKNESAEAAGKPQPYLLGLFTPSNVSFPASGSIVKADNGHTIWRAQINIEGAKAIGLYYDKFQLPKGVKYYVSNANGTQILGAYTAANNAPSKAFANEAVQGSTVYLEMDIAPGVDINKIEFHIDRSAVYFRGIEHLVKYAIDPSDLQEIDEVDTALAGRSSVCMINAICPEGAAYPNQRKAALQTVLPMGAGVGLCSATMINSAGNSAANCKRYVLTATHCDPDNSSSSSHFDQILLRFNFEQSTCNGTAIPESNTLVGANFIARANYTAVNPSDIKGDFMLLELREAIPDSWNVTLAGWNKNFNLPTTISAPKKYIGFHHPDGDVKKTSSTDEIFSMPLSQSPGAEETHWGMILNSGFVSTGSSGSGLFDGDGYLVGIASIAGAVNAPANCEQTATGQPANAFDFVSYSKLAYDFDYTVDGSANNRKLKPWLDPNNTGVVTVNPLKANCTALDGGSTGIINNNDNLANAINIYPNPNTTGKLNIQINLSETSDITMELFDVTGKSLKSYLFNKVRSGNYSLDMGNLPNGMYLLKCSDGYNSTSKKIMLTK